MPLVDYTPSTVDPLTKALQGLQIGSQIQGIRQRSEQSDRLAQTAADAKVRKAQYATDIEAAFNDGSPGAFAKLTLKYPQQKEAFKQSLATMSDEQQKNEIRMSGQVYAALQGGNTDIALNILDEQIVATENSGGDAKGIKKLRDNMERDPKNAQNYVGLMLSSIMGPKEFSKTFETLGKERRAETELPSKMQNKKEEIEIKKEQVVLRRLEAQLRKEDNVLKREELTLKVEDQRIRLGETKKGIEQKQKDRVSEASSAIATFDRTIDTIEKIVAHPGLETATGMSSWMATIPGTDARDASALVETLKSQAFLAEVEKMKGMGALSENEGKKIATAVTNLDMGQTTGAFKGNLTTALKIFKDGKKRAKSKFGKLPQPKETEEEPEATNVPSYMKYSKAQ